MLLILLNCLKPLVASNPQIVASNPQISSNPTKIVDARAIEVEEDNQQVDFTHEAPIIQVDQDAREKVSG
jgi:hypothetical protein